MVRQYVKYELYTHPNKINEKMDAFPVFSGICPIFRKYDKGKPP
jgi:hypothetical protein